MSTPNNKEAVKEFFEKFHKPNNKEWRDRLLDAKAKKHDEWGLNWNDDDFLSFIASERKLAQEEVLRRIWELTGREFTPTCGHRSEEELGFQKGLTAENKLIKKEISDYASSLGIDLK